MHIMRKGAGFGSQDADLSVFGDHITMSEIRTKSYTNFSVNF